MMKNVLLTSLVVSSCIMSPSFVLAMEDESPRVLLSTPNVSTTSPNFDQLVKGTYAVHLTQIYPQDGLMIPGSLFSLRKSIINPETQKPDESKELLTLEQRLQLAKVTPKYRFTLHWGLSGLAEDHEFSTEHGETLSLNRASHPFAILEPFEYLLPESYGGNDQDWMTVGPHKLSPQSILLAAHSHQEQTTHFPGQVIVFNPETESLENLVTQILQGHNAFVVKRDIPPSQYNVDVTLENIKEMVGTDSPTLKKFFENTGNKKKQIIKLKEKINNSPNKKWTITRYNENNIPITVDGNQHFASPKEFYSSLREKGYFWGKHEYSFFGEFEPNLKTLFLRTIIFQAKELFPEEMQDVGMPGFISSATKERLNDNMVNSPIEYPKLTIKALNTETFLKTKTRFSATTQKVFKLWLKELSIWIAYVCEKDNMEAPHFLSKESDPSLHLKRVVATASQHSTQPMMDLYK